MNQQPWCCKHRRTLNYLVVVSTATFISAIGEALGYW